MKLFMKKKLFIFLFFIIFFALFMGFIAYKSKADFKENLFKVANNIYMEFIRGLKEKRLYKVLNEIGYRDSRVAFIFVYSKKVGFLFEARNGDYFPSKYQLNTYKSWVIASMRKGGDGKITRSWKGIWIFLKPITEDKYFILGIRESWLSFFVDNYLNSFIYSSVVFSLILLGIIRYFKGMVVVNPILEDVNERNIKIDSYDDIKDFKRRIMTLPKLEDEANKILDNERAFLEEGGFLEMKEFLKSFLLEISENFSAELYVVYVRYGNKFFPVAKQKKQGVIAFYELPNRYKVIWANRVKVGKVYRSLARDGSYIYFFPIAYKGFVFSVLSVRIKGMLEHNELDGYKGHIEVVARSFFTKYRIFIGSYEKEKTDNRA